MSADPGGTASLRTLLENLCRGQDLAREESRALFGRIIRGELDEPNLAGVLVALKAKGERAAEIAGAAEALRDAALPFPTGGLDVADNCGTGGDGAQTVNVSTAAAILAAELGLRVAKHGNRSVSSRCGSADVLEAAGVRIDAPPAVARRCLDAVGVCFLFAPQYHGGIRNAMPVRRALGVRTLFNVLGPLANPARPRWQVVGVYDPVLCAPLAETLGLLGCESALVVHGGGADELALHAPTVAARWHAGRVEPLMIEPEALGLRRRPLDELRGGDAPQNARWLAQVLAGRGPDAHADVVALNAGALAWVAGRAATLADGLGAARAALLGGGAAERLRRWAELSHGAG
jgi:anthranilate phosphoribosyltransferase